jgi:ABC-type multidrug transport system fused ATPase/permease subunit
VLFSGTLRSNLDPLNNHTDAELFDALEKVHLIEPSDDSNNVNNNNNQGTTNRELINIDSAEDEEATSTNEENTTAAPINIFRNLASPISPGGANLSQGQRQLLCLARAIIRQPRIIVLDEATSAVDVGTDVLIQRSLREGFTDSTLLVIAHRLSTIADFDKILVLEGGRVAEFGTPGELWERKDGVFKGMCESSSEQERQKLETAIMGTR